MFSALDIAIQTLQHPDVNAPGDVLHTVMGVKRKLMFSGLAKKQQSKVITFFKSVGAALEDLAGAILAYEAVERA